MTKGKPWSIEEENKLKQLIEQGQSPKSIAAQLGKSEQAVRKKAERLGLKVVVRKPVTLTTTSKITLPEELPSIEEALKILAGALKAASKAGLTRVEVQRLHLIANLARTYKEILADYIDYRGIEQKLMEMEAKYTRLIKRIPIDKSQK
jgi:DNA-binding CsgD family transcriptional regulator